MGVLTTPLLGSGTAHRSRRTTGALGEGGGRRGGGTTTVCPPPGSVWRNRGSQGALLHAAPERHHPGQTGPVSRPT